MTDTSRIKAFIISPGPFPSNEFTWEGGTGWILGEIDGDPVILTVQVLGPRGGWVDTDICLTESGIKVFSLPPKVTVRIHSSSTATDYAAVLIQDTRRSDYA